MALDRGFVKTRYQIFQTPQSYTNSAAIEYVHTS